MREFQILLLAQGILGAFDTLWYHEWRARLPSQPAAVRETQFQPQQHYRRLDPACPGGHLDRGCNRGAMFATGRPGCEGYRGRGGVGPHFGVGQSRSQHSCRIQCRSKTLDRGDGRGGR